jgi:hypothetical protein
MHACVQAIQNNPIHAVPVVVARLEQKAVEWRRAQVSTFNCVFLMLSNSSRDNQLMLCCFSVNGRVFGEKSLLPITSKLSITK